MTETPAVALTPQNPTTPPDSGPNAADARLRRFGFRIHSRPPAGDPLWFCEGVVYTQAEAEDRVRRAVASTARG